jgi:transcription initiation factor IIF auxiliary subunit
MPEATPPVEDVKFNNIARHVGTKYGKDWYEWMVYVDEKDEVLEQIKAVEYLLHRTFPDPLRVIEVPYNKFACESSGWGEFWIAITVFFRNGARFETSYYLDLSKNWRIDVFLGPESDI